MSNNNFVQKEKAMLVGVVYGGLDRNKVNNEIDKVITCFKDKIIEKINFVEIFPDAIGRFFVLSTFLSNFLSTISFTIQPADLINIEPRRKNIR